MRDMLARIRKRWLVVGLAVVMLAVVWLVVLFANMSDGNAGILAVSISGARSRVMRARASSSPPSGSGRFAMATVSALSLEDTETRSKAFRMAVVMEAHVHGVSTRKVDDLVRAL